MKRLIPILILFLFAGFRPGEDEKRQVINGINFVAPPHEANAEIYTGLNRIGAQWVALNPFAYANRGKTDLRFDEPWQWWGERPGGMEKMLQYAQQAGLKVMIKPHIWVRGEGWAGAFGCNSEEEWQAWEQSHEKFILTYAKLAEQYGVGILCIGTETKKWVQDRPHYWEALIDKVRGVYSGKLTYAANWDNFENVRFWDRLDYIGIDCYFPVSEAKKPEVKALLNGWAPHKERLQNYSTERGKPVIFTEFGYRSIDQTAWKQWLLPESFETGKGGVNLTAQVNAYSAIFQAFWDEPWFAGGFIWKWYPQDDRVGGTKDKDYTPQHKPVEALIKAWYERSPG